MANPNLQLLTDAAKLLEPILPELVFVGGCATALMITDHAAVDVRPTFDVDAMRTAPGSTSGASTCCRRKTDTTRQQKFNRRLNQGGLVRWPSFSF